MKKFITTLFFLCLFSLSTFAQDLPSTILKGHMGPVNSVAFSPDGKTFASGSWDKNIGLWEADTGKHIRTIEGKAVDRLGTIINTFGEDTETVDNVSFSPDGQVLASREYRTIRLWDVRTGEHLRTLRGPTGASRLMYSTNDVAFSPDGRTIASGGYLDNTVRFWDVRTGNDLRTLRGHTGSVDSVAFSPDGNTIATGSRDNTIRFWDVTTGTPLHILEGHTDWIPSISFSPDGRVLVSGSWDKTIRLWDARTGEHLRTLEEQTSGIRGVLFSPDSLTFASQVKETIRLWDVRTGEHLRTLEGHTGSIQSISFSPDGRVLVSGNRDYTIHFWEVSTGNHLHTHTISGERHSNPVICVAFSPDGKTLAIGSAPGSDRIHLWAIDIPGYLRTINGHTRSVESVAFSPDGQTLASGSVDETIRLWEADTGNHLRTLRGHTRSVESVAFSPDGQTLASADYIKEIRLWNATTGELLKVIEHNDSYLSEIAFSLDGKTLASAHYSREKRYAHQIRLWDVNTGEPLERLQLSWGRSVAFSPDGKTLAGGGSHNNFGDVILFWDAITREHTHTLRGHTETVTSIAFSPDSSMLASGSYDNTIGLWSATAGKRTYTLEGHTEPVRSVAFSSDGSMLASGSADNTIRLWELPGTRIRLTPDLVVSPAIGEQFSVNVNIVAGENVGGYQFSVVFDPAALRYVESANGDYLPSGAFFVPPVVSSKAVTLGATSFAGVSAGDGTLATVTFEVLDVKESVIDLFNIILTDSAGEHLPQLPHIPTKVVEPSLLPTDAIISLTPSSVLSPAIGERLTFNIDITSGQNVKDVALTLDFDQSALKHVSSNSGEYLANGVGNGDGILEMVTFEVLAVKASTISLSGHLIGTNGLLYAPTFESAKVIVPLFGDVNRDGSVNILDLVQVASKFGQRVSGDPADVNEDGVVNIVDLVKVAGALGGAAAAPSAWSLDLEGTFTREQVQQWLSEAEQSNLTDATAQRGIHYLEQLLAALTPKETALLANYPNPFNPETWIPYQLAQPADVTVTIYAVDGTVVRLLVLGHQPIGIYQGKTRAAYWDGRNAIGEPVASGVYFYTLTAGEITATRKMLVRK